MIKIFTNYLKIKFCLGILLGSLFWSSSAIGQDQMNHNDSLAVKAIVEAMNLPNWPNPITDTNNRAIALGFRNAKGYIPDEIGNLSSLKTLEMNALFCGDCLFIDSISTRIGDLIQLEQLLIIQANSLRELPESFSNLTNLTHADFNRTYLRKLPEQIGNLKRLKSLNLSGFAQSVGLNDLPASFADLDSLTYLSLDGKPLKRFPKEICDLASLKILGANWCMLDSIPSCIGNLSTLKAMYLGGNEITSIPPEIGGLRSLEELGLAKNRIKEIPDEIQYLDSLKGLHLGENQIQEINPAIGQLSNLEDLGLYTNQIKEIDPAIGQLSKLRIFVISNNQITKIPQEISQLTNLQRLYLHNNYLDSLPSFIGNLGNLEILNLENAYDNFRRRFLGNNHISYLPPEILNLAKLRELYLRGNELTDLPNLNQLSLERLNLAQNYLDFGDLMPYQSLLQDSVRYAPQKNLPAAPAKLYLVENEASQIFREFGHADDEYAWFKIEAQDTIPQEATVNYFDISNPLPSDTGRYYCTIENIGLPALTLETEPTQAIFVPASPSNLRAEAFPFKRSIALNWQDNSIYESQYIVQRRLKPDSALRFPQDTLFVNVATLARNIFSYRDTVANTEADYEYRILMLAQDSSLFYTDTLLYSIPTNSKWIPPIKNFQIVNADCRQVGLTWEDNSDGSAQGFEIERKASDESTYVLIDFVAASENNNFMTYIDSGADAEKEYSYRVRAIGPDPAEDRAFMTNSLNVFTEIKSVAPTRLRAKSQPDKTVRVTWLNSPQNCEVSLFVEKAVGTLEQFEVIQTLSDQDSICIDRDVEMKVQYFYRIRVGTENPVYSRIRSLMILPNAEERKDSTDQDSFEFALENIDRFIKIYPNPSSEVLHIRMKHPKQGEVEMELYNPQGHLVQEVSYFKPKGFQTFTWKLNPSNLSPGAYQLRLQWKDKYLFKTLIIEL